MEQEYCGKLIRLLIDNHRRNRLISKLEIRDIFKLDVLDLNLLLKHLREYLEKLGLELVGISDLKICNVESAKKLFLRKLFREIKEEDAHLEATLEEKRLFTVFSLIQLENNNLDERKFNQIRGCKYFANIKLEDVFSKAKSHGYLISRKVDDNIFWSLGWRFYSEYADSLDVVDYFSEKTLA